MMANNNINMNIDQHIQINPVPQGPPMIRGEPVHACLAAQFNQAVACATANPGAKDMLEDLFHKLNFFVSKMASMGANFFSTFTDFAYTIPQGLLQPANQLNLIPDYLAQLAAQISVLKVQFLTQAKKVDRRAANTVPNKIAELKQQQAIDLQHCERLVEAMSARKDQIKLLSAADETLKYMISLENPIQSVGFSRDRATNLLTAAFTNSLLPSNADDGIAEITAAMGRSAFDGSGSMSMVPFRGGRGPMNH